MHPAIKATVWYRAHPPLVGSKWATSDPALISYIILNGLKGEIVVKGETYGTTAAVNMAAVLFPTGNCKCNDLCKTGLGK